MRKTNGNQIERPSRDPAVESVVALLADAGLRAEQVERCPEADCPVCSRRNRVAA